MTNWESITRGAQVPLAGHQDSFVAEVLSAPEGARFALLAPFGTGKTTALRGLVSQVIRHSPDARVLVVGVSLGTLPDAEPPITVIDPDAFRRRQTTSESHRQVWAELKGIVITDADFISQRRRFGPALTVTWDLIVMDEIERITFQKSLLPFIRAVCESNNVGRAVFAGAMMDSGALEAECSTVRVIKWGKGTPAFRLILRTALQRGVIQEVRFELSDNERSFRSAYSEAVLALSVDEAISGRLKRRSRDPIFSIELELRRLVAEAETAWLGADKSAGLIDDFAFSALGPLAKWLLSIAEQVEQDSRWAALRAILGEKSASEQEYPVLIVVETEAVASHVSMLLAEDFQTPTTLVGSTVTGPGDRLARQLDAGTRVFVASSESLGDLPTVRYATVIHYDLPLTAFGLAARIAATVCGANGWAEYPYPRQIFLLEGAEEQRALHEFLATVVSGY